MCAWWSKAIPDEKEPDDQDNEEQGDDEGVGGEEEEEEEPDEAVTAKAEKLFGQRAEAMQKKLEAFGLSLSDEGEPVVSDPKKLREWVGPLSEPAPPAPAPVAAAPPVEEPEFDILDMSREKLQKMIREEAEKLAQPLQERLVQQQSLISKRWVDDAMSRTGAALAEYAPDMSHIVEHPQFEELYRAQLEKMEPGWLEHPQVLASTALGLIAWLDGKKMPTRKSGAEVAARGMVNRMNVPSMAAGGSSTVSGGHQRGGEYANAVQFLNDARIVNTTPEELEALDAVDEWGFHTVKAYQAAMEKRKGRKAAK